VNGRLGYALATVLFLGILTSWAEGYWPVALVVCGVFLVAGVWTARAMVRQEAVITSPLLALTAATVVWGALQLAAGHSAYPFETGKSLLYWGSNATAFFLALQISVETQVRNRLLRMVLWFGFGVSVLTVVEYFTSAGKVYWLFPTPYPRTLGPFLYKNQCAAFMELIFPLAVYQALVDRRHSLLYIAMAASMFAAVITAVSRAGAVLVVCELVAIVALAWFRGLIEAENLRRTLVRMAALSLALASVVGWQVTLEKFHEPEPYRVRRELLLSSIAMIGDRPWLGFGLGTWPAVYPAYARFDNGLIANRAHNDWAEWAAEGGLPFFALLAVMAAWSVPRAADSLWGLGIVAVFLHSLVDYPLREPALGALLFAMLGALAGRDKGLAPEIPRRRRGDAATRRKLGTGDGETGRRGDNTQHGDAATQRQ
jgi:O-antigen ligase/polysaccharide polymerase Wzy-like membrane protein